MKWARYQRGTVRSNGGGEGGIEGIRKGRSKGKKERW
jgi:hypothetical protein